MAGFITDIDTEFLAHMQMVENEDGTVFFQSTPERTAVKLPALLVRGIRDMRNSNVLLLPRRDGGHPITVHMWRHTQTCRVTGAKLSSRCLLTLDPEEELVLDERCLQEGFDLTPAEVRVATGIASCKRIETIAGELGITPSTARTHLKRIFDKTETRRQSELVRLMGCVGHRKSRSIVSESLVPDDLKMGRIS